MFCELLACRAWTEGAGVSGSRGVLTGMSSEGQDFGNEGLLERAERTGAGRWQTARSLGTISLSWGPPPDLGRSGEGEACCPVSGRRAAADKPGQSCSPKPYLSAASD
jgi:hypothetical protein